VREQVLANLVSVLAAMAPPATNYRFQTVRRWGGGILERGLEQPACLIIPVVETSNQERQAIIEHELDVALTCSLLDADWQTKIEQLAADVRVAVLADYSRGGAAMDTRIISTEIFPALPGSPLACAQVNLRIVYRTLFTDPSEPH
jgi:hypothetical protein